MSKNKLVYCIDGNDLLTSVSDNWCSFAEENDWLPEDGAIEVVGQPIWKYISGKELRLLYEELFAQVRQSKNIGSIPFRCDAPAMRRSLQMTFDALPDNGIRITSKILQNDEREFLEILDINTPRSGEYLNICSMCKKIKIEPDQWLELDLAVRHLHLFEVEKLPQISHGICPACYRMVMDQLKQSEETDDVPHAYL